MLNSNRTKPHSRASHKKGVTLVEVLVVIAILGIISVVVVQMMGTGRSVIGTHQDMMNDNSSALVVEAAIKQNLKFANQAKLIPVPGQAPSPEQITKDIEGMETDKPVEIHYIYNAPEGVQYQVYDNNKKKIKEQLLLQDPQIKVAFEKVEQFKSLIQITIGGGSEQAVKSQVELTNFPQSQEMLGSNASEAIVFLTWAQ